jgi:hypothetical protein
MWCCFPLALRTSFIISSGMGLLATFSAFVYLKKFLFYLHLQKRFTFFSFNCLVVMLLSSGCITSKAELIFYFFEYYVSFFLQVAFKISAF